MREVIVTGKTVEEATENACAQLGLSRDEVSIEILEMPVKKLFRSIPAKVKAIDMNESEQPVQKTETVAEPVVQQPVEQPQPQQVQPVEEASKEETQAQTAEQQPTEEMNEKIQIAVSYLADIFEKMGVSGTTITPIQQNEAVVLKVEGEKAGTLIGRRGETMEALSYLASLAANRSGGDYLKLGLDVAGYRSKRESDLAALAHRIGARVLKNGRSQELEPMNPYERRIIHSAISEMEGVHSESRGEGADRRVVIYPDNPAPRSGRRSNNRNNRTGGGRGSRPNRGYSHNHSARNSTKEESKAPRRTETLNDGEGIALYGKIEL